MMLDKILLESGYFSAKPFKPKVVGNFCHDATINISAVNGDCPCFSRFSAARRIFSGTVKSSTFGFVAVDTRVPQSSKVCGETVRTSFGFDPPEWRLNQITPPLFNKSIEREKLFKTRQNRRGRGKPGNDSCRAGYTSFFAFDQLAQLAARMRFAAHPQLLSVHSPSSTAISDLTNSRKRMVA